MHTRIHALSAILVFGAVTAPGVRAQTCPVGEVRQVDIVPGPQPSQLNTALVTLPDGRARNVRPKDHAWPVVLEDCVAVAGFRLDVEVEGYWVSDVDSVSPVRREGDVGIYDVTLEQAFTLSPEATGGTIHVAMDSAFRVKGEDPAKTARFRENDTVDLQIFTSENVYHYNVGLPGLKMENGMARHEKRQIMDGVCDAMKPSKRLCACKSRWTLLSCWTQKRDISTSAIEYSKQ